MALTARQQSFVDAYLANGGNATQAAISAGYSEKTANVASGQLLGNVRIAEEIAIRRASLATKRHMTAADVISAFEKMAELDPAEVFKVDENGKVTLRGTLDELPVEARKCIKTIKQGKNGLEVVLYPRSDALKEVARLRGYETPPVAIKPILCREDALQELNRVSGLAASGEINVAAADAAIRRINAALAAVTAIENKTLIERIERLEAYLRGESDDSLENADIRDTSGNKP